jgi:hypothetical protein
VVMYKKNLKRQLAQDSSIHKKYEDLIILLDTSKQRVLNTSPLGLVWFKEKLEQ